MISLLIDKLKISNKQKDIEDIVRSKMLDEQANLESNTKDEANNEDVQDLVRMGIVTFMDQFHLSINWKYWADIDIIKGSLRSSVKMHAFVKFRLEKLPNDEFKVVEILESSSQCWDFPDQLKAIHEEQKLKCQKLFTDHCEKFNYHDFNKNKRKLVNLIKPDNPPTPLTAEVDEAAWNFAFETAPVVTSTPQLQGDQADKANTKDPNEPIPAVISLKSGETRYVEMNYGQTADDQELTYTKRTIDGTVLEVSDTFLKIDTESHTFELNPSDLQLSYKLAEYDQLLCVCRLCEAEDFNTSSTCVTELLQVKPGMMSSKLTFSVKAVHEEYGVLSDNGTYFLRNQPLEKCSETAAALKVGEHVMVDAIPTGKEQFSWRCIRLTRVEASATPVQQSRFTKLLLKADNLWSTDKIAVPPQMAIVQRRFVAKSIGKFEIPVELKKAYLNLKKKQLKYSALLKQYTCLLEDLSYVNYVQRFATLVHLEEIEQFIEMRGYDMPETQLVRDESGNITLYIENLGERRPSLIIGDSVRVEALSVDSSSTVRPFIGVIKKVLLDRIHLKFNDAFERNIENRLFRVEFYYSRAPYRLLHHSVFFVWQRFGEKLLFPTEMRLREIPAHNLKMISTGLYDKSNRYVHRLFQPDLNTQQRQAVCNVLRNETDGMPYIIFGPPGTGKTKTIVEIALQMRNLSPHSHLLIATPSNSSADLLATRILELIDNKNDLVRVVSYNMYEKDLVPPHLVEFSCTVDKGIDGTCSGQNYELENGMTMQASMAHISKYHIVIATCGTMSNLLYLGFKRHQFCYLIVDEAGQCTEPDTMVPIALLYKRYFQVVLVGDPNQLEPTVLNTVADNKGLSMSMLERFLTNPLYEKHAHMYTDNCGYDPRLVTKLVHNYRALPSILKVYSDLFYYSELHAILDEHTSDEAVMLKSLTAALPVIKKSTKRPSSHGVFFYGLDAEHKQLDDSPSWYNAGEARKVFEVTKSLYDLNIASHQIGIITPYSRQVKHLQDIFMTCCMDAPKIGTVQEFQGQERDIILITPVRSTAAYAGGNLRHSLGFLKNHRRLNVAISRARCLLIVIGNPIHLSRNHHWAMFIKYCIENDAYMGIPLPLELQYPLKIKGSAESCAKDTVNTDKEFKRELMKSIYNASSDDDNDHDDDDDVSGVSTSVHIPRNVKDLRI